MKNKLDIEKAIEDFLKISKLAKFEITKKDLNVEILSTPHKTCSLPKNKIALYGFNYSGMWLKIGIVGDNSNQRFSYQHYNPRSSRSNLAKSILNNLDKITEDKIEEDEIGRWIRNNCTRINIYIPEKKGKLILRLLEAFLHVRFSPIFER